MTVRETCPRCDQPLSGGFLTGLCPRCLARVISSSFLYAKQDRRFGNYELLAEIGRGGMGIVYKARQTGLNRLVAIKMMLGGHLASEAELERFHAEAEAVATLDHPNIVSIYEVGVHEGQPYFSMQWINGKSLAAQASSAPLAPRPSGPAPFSCRQAAELLVKVARAVHHAHQRGILHRDLKPANILLDAAGEPHVSDFGLARNLAVGDNVTIPGVVLGSPGFIAPEQASGKTKQLTTAVDIYSLGAVLYYLLTGHPPFFEALAPRPSGLLPGIETLRAVLEKEPRRPKSLNPGVDSDLDTICLKCLRKEPARRYSSADALADDLERWLRHEAIRARPVGMAEQAVKWTRRKPTLASLICAVILIAAAGLAAVLREWRQAEAAGRRAALAEQDGLEKLHASYLAQARANRWSGRPGRRFDSLEVLAKAAAIRPALELRNEAIACLALPDVRVQQRFRFDGLTPGGLVFDARMKRYVQAKPDGTIVIRRTSNHQPLLRLLGPAKAWWSGFMFSPDGHYLAEKYVGPQTNQVRVWDLTTGALVISEPMAVRGLCFRPDSHEFSAAEENGSIGCFALPRSGEVRRLAVPPPLQAISYDPEGKRLAVARRENPAVLILNLDSGEIEQRVGCPGPVGLVAWSPDGARLACPSEDGRTYLRSVMDGKLETVLEGHAGVVTAALFNRNGDVLLTSGWDGTTRFWDPRLGQAWFSLPGGWIPIGFGCDDRVGIGTADGEAAIWQVEPARECQRLGRTDMVWRGQFSPDARLLAVACTDGVWIWDLVANHLLEHLPVPESRSVLFTPDGRSLVSSGLTGLRRYEIEKTGSAIRISPASILAAGAYEGSCLGPDGRTLILACGASPDSDLLITDLQAPGSLNPIHGHARAASATISPDGKWFASGTWKGTNVQVWHAPSHQPVQELSVHGNAVGLFSPDGAWLVTGSEAEYRFWRVGSWEIGQVIQRENAGDMYGAMAFSPDSKILALLRGRNSDVRLVSVPEGHELGKLETGRPLCFSSDGRFLATAGDDLHSVFLWDLRLIRSELAAMRLDWNAADTH